MTPLEELVRRIHPLLLRTREIRKEMLGRPCAMMENVTAEHLASAVLSTIETVTNTLVDKPLRAPVLSRKKLLLRWNFNDISPNSRELQEIGATEYDLGMIESCSIPNNVSLEEIATCLRRAPDPRAHSIAKALANATLYEQEEPEGRIMIEMKEPSDWFEEKLKEASEEEATSDPTGERSVWTFHAAALIASVVKDVESDRLKQAIAIDSHKTNHEFSQGLAKAAKQKNVKKRRATNESERIEIIFPGQEGLKLSVDESCVTEAFNDAIREFRSWFGLRNWAALQRLFSVEGVRSGKVRWRIDDHLEALGVSQRLREDLDYRKKISTEVELLTKLELAIYNTDGSLRARQPILKVGTKFDRLRDSKWELEGMELEMNPWLYHGVRNQKTGKLGTHWFPAPIEVAQIDHSELPHAIALGLILPIRFRWTWANEGRDYLAISAKNLLELASITMDPVHPGRAWDTLRKSVHELLRIKLLGHAEWKGPRCEMDTIVHLHPAEWILDRTVHKLPPIEIIKNEPKPLTGAELEKWRKGKGMSQAEAAKLLKAGERSIRRAEADPTKPLSRALAAKVTKATGQITAHLGDKTGQITAHLGEEPAKSPHTLEKALL